jgi:hypothetical protein
MITAAKITHPLGSAARRVVVLAGTRPVLSGVAIYRPFVSVML